MNSARPSLGSPTLLLVPTELESQRLDDAGGFEPGSALQALCGFGPVAAAARTSELLSRLRPARALLVGICGSYDDERAPVGSALEFGRVHLDGVGVGEGSRFVGPPALGFPQWPGSVDAGNEGQGDSPARLSPIYDEIQLASDSEALLLTTCAASDSPEHAAERLERHPALGEDMEGFAVALSCALAGVPLRIVRGVSNIVGDRDPAHWRIPSALQAARRLALDVLHDSEGWKAATPTHAS
ncbi:MAG: futalosine hydrolase [Planctomycetota bacterium]